MASKAAAKTRGGLTMETVRHTCEEFQCEECGFPFYTGDSFYFDPRTDAASCSVMCAEALRARGALRPSPVFALDAEF